ncbi:hypothetical protein POSPLADRAFT_1045730 [Postia placenta MAD-698-R-SB12]|uniref:Uncharacterized protein n=1 Tax=Postia placenta MAD-698-R-SB12 TaxID=670580 RepID=A0A1X6N429_9APHY|nr:hypothetical protein POSPLADRAFT_1045730 [Postia placenta MAD-698-R-SB12]OSX63399.1 hypothetical protein POSPLADRAFT_1045730 [Postia placenta MAD-698-R-SB12]
MWCKAEPNLTGLAGSTTRDHAPFHSNPDLKALGRDGYIYSFTLWVHRSSLLTRLSALPPGTTAELPVIQWEAWGPAVCRWFEMEGRSVRWITMTCGQRFVTNDVNYTGTRGSITVIDFNPLAIRRSLARHGLSVSTLGVPLPPIVRHGPESDVVVHFEFGADPMESPVFVDPGVSSLPYMSTTREASCESGSLMMDEDLLIELQLDDSERIKALLVHSIAPLSRQ